MDLSKYPILTSIIKSAEETQKKLKAPFVLRHPFVSGAGMAGLGAGVGGLAGLLGGADYGGSQSADSILAHVRGSLGLPDNNFESAAQGDTRAMQEIAQDAAAGGGIGAAGGALAGLGLHGLHSRAVRKDYEKDKMRAFLASLQKAQ